MRRWFRDGCILVALTMCALTQWTATAGAGSVTWKRDDIFVVYVATPETGGEDANHGRSATKPVASLGRVHDVLRLARPDTDVEVRIGPGTHESEPMMAWRFYVPGGTVTFLPRDYEIGGDDIEARDRPVFRNARCDDGAFCDGSWMTARPPLHAHDPLYNGGDSGLRFYHLTFERYSAAAISIMGDSEREVEDDGWDPPLRQRGGKGLNNNRFEGLLIRRIGNEWSGGHYGWGGIVLTNSSKNTIVRNRFAGIENTSPHGGYIHGVYITHFSSGNLVRDNEFIQISGDPVKVRNRSNDNTIEQNLFRRTGVASYFRDEFCDRRCAIRHEMAQQCPSYGNRFVGNHLESGYASRQLPVWSVDSGSFPYSERSVCRVPGDRPPLVTGGNVRR